MNPDGLSYLDMATQSLKSGPSHLVNGYWSPLYPSLIAVSLALVRPSPSTEFPAVQVANFLIFCGVLLCFTFLVRSWIALQNDAHDADRNARNDLTVFCFGMFLWLTMDFTRSTIASPDLCVTGIVFLVAGICCCICRVKSSKLSHFIALGAALGLGYYAKAVMFPGSLILLALLFALPPPGTRARLKVALACFAFLIAAAPLVTITSRRVGHLSIGDAGNINYAWYVNQLPSYPDWNPAGEDNTVYGTPEHRLHTLVYMPVVLDFATHTGGTVSLWYDISYWFSGAKIQFNLRQQWATLKANCHFYLKFLARMLPILSGAFALCILDFSRYSVSRPNNVSLWLIIWPLATFGMYGLVHVAERFLPGFIFLLLLAVYTELLQQIHPAVRRAVLLTVTLALLMSTAISMAHTFKMGIEDSQNKPEYILVGDTLKAAGIHQGDSLAAAGGYDFGMGVGNIRQSSAYHAYYAHYIGARVVAAIFDAGDGKDVPLRPPPGFWHISEQDLKRVEDALATIGVKAIVGFDRPADSTPADWQDVRHTHYSILFLNTSGPAAHQNR